MGKTPRASDDHKDDETHGKNVQAATASFLEAATATVAVPAALLRPPHDA